MKIFYEIENFKQLTIHTSYGKLRDLLYEINGIIIRYQKCNAFPLMVECVLEELIAVFKKDFNNLPVEYYRAILNHWVVQILFALQLICSAASLFGFFETSSSDSVYLLILAVAYFIDLLLYKKGVYKTVVPVILILAQNVLVIFLN